MGVGVEGVDEEGGDTVGGADVTGGSGSVSAVGSTESLLPQWASTKSSPMLSRKMKWRWCMMSC